MSIWKNINSALVVVGFSSIYDLKDYRTALKKAGLNIHDCAILTVVPSKKEKAMLGELSSVTFLAENDFNFLGKLKNEEARKVLDRKYDAVICIQDPPKKIMNLLRKVKKKMLIGLNCTNSSYHVNLITKGETPEHLVNFVKHTLEKIN